MDARRLYDALDDERALRGLSWAGVAREIGVAPSTILRTRSGGAMECDGFLAMVRWLRRSAEEFAPDWPRRAAKPLRPGRFDARALYAALQSARLRRGLTWRAVADELGSGVTPAMLTRLRSGGRLSAGLALSAVRWLDMSMNEFVKL